MPFKLDANQISRLLSSDNRRAQELLPSLVLRLINATAVVKGFRFLEGDSIRLPGPDGRTKITIGNQFVPDGYGLWEISTSKMVKRKANKDFGKPVPSDVDPTNTTYIAVSSHIWKDKEKKAWIDETKKTGKWCDVRLIDAVDLEAWLNLAPVVKRWFMLELGAPISGLRHIELYWSELAAQYNQTNLSPELIIGGRIEIAGKIRTGIEAGQRIIAIQGESPEEVCAFVAAVILQMAAPTGELLKVRTVFIDTPDAAEWISNLISEYLIIPTTVDARRRIFAINLPYIRIIDPRDRPGPGRQSDNLPIVLGEVKKQSCINALLKMHFSMQNAERIAGQSKGSFTALMWGLSLGPDRPLPWTVGEAIVELLPLLLVGQWDTQTRKGIVKDKNGIVQDIEIYDKLIIAQICEQSYEKIELILSKWQGPMGPIIRRGNIWDWKALDFAWKELASKLTPTLVGKFLDIAFKVLGTPDPAIKLSTDTRWAATAYGAIHPYSENLRSGLVNSLIQLALHDDILDGQCQGKIDRFINDLLSGEKLPIIDTWYSLAYWLPDLAEAAPKSFLNCIDKLISDANAIFKLFEEIGPFGMSQHTNLLWALERLAWFPEYLGQATIALGKLAEIDPGGRLSNRPFNSLHQIFILWHPSTTANPKQRLDAIKALRNSTPKIAWKLAVSLLPKPHEMTMKGNQPRWRSLNEIMPVKPNEYAEGLKILTDILLDWVGDDSKQWNELINEYDDIWRVYPDQAQRIIVMMQSQKFEEWSEESKATIWNTIRSLIQKHEHFANATWAIPFEVLNPLKELKQRLMPKSTIERHAWLFDWNADLFITPIEDIQEHQKRLWDIRDKALLEVFNECGLDGVFELSAKADDHTAPGTSLARINHDSIIENKLIEAAFREGQHSETSPAFWVFKGYAWLRYRNEGIAWLEHITSYDIIKNNDASLIMLAEIFAPTAKLWNFLAAQSESALKLYWKRASIAFIEQPKEDLPIAVKGLMEAGRFYTVLKLIGMIAISTHENEHLSITPDNIIEILKVAATQNSLEEHSSSQIDSHYISQIFNWLERKGISTDTLAKLEWEWLAVLMHSDYEAKALQKVVTENPIEFVGLLEMAFKEEDGPSRQLTEPQREAGIKASFFLREIKRVPGLADVKKTSADGQDISIVDEAKLRAWVDGARFRAQEVHRLGLCDTFIGELFAYSPYDADGNWPCISVRNVIEEIKITELEHGIMVGVYNKRGSHFVEPGGKGELTLADKYQKYADAIANRWPRTGQILRTIAEQYRREAKDNITRELQEEFE
jgi:hypothetical protein